MRGVGAVLLAVSLGGCTSVKLEQRDGCWVRKTEKWPGRVREEIGPCARPAPVWVEDRLTRLVQECVARVDYQWQTRALAAWNRGEKLPEQATEASVLNECMSDAANAFVAENDNLKARLGDVTSDRDALRRRSNAEREHLMASYDKLADYLGKAAEKSAQPAVATATASSDSDGRAGTETASPAPVTAVEPAAAAATHPVRRAQIERKAARSRSAACGPCAGQGRPAAASPSMTEAVKAAPAASP